MTRRSIKEYAEALRPRYAAASKADRGRLLDEFCATTGYHRKAAVRTLRQRPQPNVQRRGRPRTYGSAVGAALVKVWEMSDRLCSKRLVPFLPDLVDALERHHELTLEPKVRAQLVGLSSATIDRLLAPHRAGGRRRPYTQGPATPSIRAQIPIRTFGEWTDVAPGSVQADLVMHCGESVEGFHLTTLTAVDVATGWTECRIVWGKGQERVGGAAYHVKEGLPFALRELHTDNGGEFLNAVLYPWCQRYAITLSRGRPYKKNDQAYVEQKNWFVVRRLIGYDRYSTKAAYAVFERLYEALRLYLNFFQPVRKLVGKERDGARVTKRYDRAQTPYQRLCAASILTDVQRADLERRYRWLNPVKLRAEIDRHLDKLWSLADRPHHPDRAAAADLSTNPQSNQREKKERTKERKEKEATTTTATIR